MIEISKKIILVGSVNVGKTSLVNQYIHHRFSEQYISTIGVRIDKKQIEIKGTILNLIIWDLAGESSQQNTPQSYFLGAGGIIYVVDATSPPTFLNMSEEIAFLKSKLPHVPLLIVANKCDLLNDSEMNATKKLFPKTPDFLSSAKTGDYVEDVFSQLAELLLL